MEKPSGPAQMATLTEVAPVLRVSSMTMKPMLAFFGDTLGFALETHGDPPGFAMVSRDGQTLMLTCAAPFLFHAKDWAAYFRVDDVDALHAEFTGRGAHINDGLTDKDYGIREFEVVTPDGRLIAFGQPMDGRSTKMDRATTIADRED